MNIFKQTSKFHSPINIQMIGILCLFLCLSSTISFGQAPIDWIPKLPDIQADPSHAYSHTSGIHHTKATNALPDCKNGWIEFTVDDIPQSSIIVGFSDGNSSAPFHTDYGLYFESSAGSPNGHIRFIINGSLVTWSPSTCNFFAPGDRFRIERVGNEIKFHHLTTSLPAPFYNAPCQLVTQNSVLVSPNSNWTPTVAFINNGIQPNSISDALASFSDGCSTDDDWTGAGTGSMYPVFLGDNIGVGTNNPTSKLDVNGEVKVRTLNQNNDLEKIVVADNSGLLQYRDASSLMPEIPDFEHDKDWLTTSNQTSENLSDNIYTNGRVGIGQSNPSARLHLNGAFCDGSPALKISQSNSGCPFPSNGFGNLLEIETASFFSPPTKRFLVTQSGRVGINQAKPLADLEVGGQGIMVIDAFSKSYCPTRRSGLYFRRNYSPYGSANSPDELKNMSIRPRGLCSSGNGSQDGLEINGWDGVTLTTLGKDRLAVTASGNVRIGFDMPDCTGENNVDGCWNSGFLLDVDGHAAVRGQAWKPGGGSWVALSDKRLKEKVNTFEDGLEVLKQIKPVFYHYNKTSGLDTEQEHVGVIAQDLKKAAPYMVQGDYKTAENSEEYYTVDPSAFDYILINSVKEQQALIEAQAKVIEKQQTMLDDLMKRLEKIEAGSNTNSNTSTSNARQVEDETLEGLVLRQNTPNPFSQWTSIEYQLPSLAENTSLKIYDLSGTLVARYPLNQREGMIEIEASSFSSGTYIYAIEVGSEQLISKKMVIQH